MDTGTHFIMGLSLAGLSYIDPVVASNPALAGAVLVGTVLGSQAPDSDSLLRLKSNALYIRNHRGTSHSLPFLLLWTALITAIISLFFSSIPILHVALWTGIAVCVHVFTDLFNTYGTQALRPFSKRWISWNIIHIFDVYLFGSHALSVLLWISGVFRPVPLFTTLYILTAFYFLLRTVVHHVKTKQLKQLDQHHQASLQYTLIPTIHFNRWHVVKKLGEQHYCIGHLSGKKLVWKQEVRSSNHPAVEKSRSHPDVSAFVYFTSYAAAEVETLKWGYVVRWVDVRYKHRKQYPFVAVVVMDKDYRPINSYVGWLNDKKMNARLSLSHFS